MNYAIIDGTTVKNTGTIQQLFPNTSFPVSGVTTDFLTENNVVELVETLSYTTPTQKIITVDPYVQSGKAYNVKVENTTTEEQATLTSQKWIEIREIRNQILKDTDWRASSDLTLSDDWKKYRNDLRQIPQTQTDPFNITWPTSPS
tara:strand:+ start:8337 stop:8774 length:438 start_codon:yes stop_codon:yes gene_type:complete